MSLERVIAMPEPDHSRVFHHTETRPQHSRARVDPMLRKVARLPVAVEAVAHYSVGSMLLVAKLVAMGWEQRERRE